MILHLPFRPAREEDCRRIAELFIIASGGIAEYVWTTMTADQPDLSPLEMGIRRYAGDETPFSDRNRIVAEQDGHVIRMMVAFPAEVEAEADSAEGDSADGGIDDIPAPFRQLEAPGSYSISGIAIDPAHRGHGLGTRHLVLAREQAQANHVDPLSLPAFSTLSFATAAPSS